MVMYTPKINLKHITRRTRGIKCTCTDTPYFSYRCWLCQQSRTHNDTPLLSCLLKTTAFSSLLTEYSPWFFMVCLPIKCSSRWFIFDNSVYIINIKFTNKGIIYCVTPDTIILGNVIVIPYFPDNMSRLQFIL